MRTAKISKVAFTIFGMIGSALPFLDFMFFPGPESLVSAVALSLAISLAYIVFYSLQILPSFPNANSFSMLSSLPISERDFSLIAMLSFVRTFDYLAAGSSFLQVFLVWYLTDSPVAALLMLLGAFVNVTFAVAIALWFSGIFYRNLTKGGRSKGSTLGRILFLVTWGFVALSIGFIFNFISYILPFLNNAIGGNTVQPSGLLLSVFHPFSISLAIADVVYPTFLMHPVLAGSSTLLAEFLPLLLVSGSVICYFALSIFVGTRTLSSVSKIARGDSGKITRHEAADFGLKLRSPLYAHAIKDLRSATKNPSVAFLYALPLFVVFVLAIVTAQFPVMHASAVIASTVVGCAFTLLISSTLLNTDAADREYTLSLPVRLGEIIDAKTLIATLTFIPVPIALAVIGLSKQLTSTYSLLIPFIELPVMYAACMAEIFLFFGGYARGPSGRGLRVRGFSMMAASDVWRLIECLSVAFLLVLIPLAGYSIEFLRSANYPQSIGIMLLLSIAEAVGVPWIKNRITRVDSYAPESSEDLLSPNFSVEKRSQDDSSERTLPQDHRVIR
jgi:Membrane protein of 12 TMs